MGPPKQRRFGRVRDEAASDGGALESRLIALGAPLLAFPGLAHAETSCADLAKANLPHAQVLSATMEKAGAGEACRIAVTEPSDQDSDIRLEVWIPMGDAWNGKFVQLGNGGFAGQVQSSAVRWPAAAMPPPGPTMATRARCHLGLWALGEPEKFIDFGWRALKETTDVSKALIGARRADAEEGLFLRLLGRRREALMEAQRFPTDFDGIVAGAPANYMSQLFGLGRPAPGAGRARRLPRPSQRKLLQKAALAQCGEGGAFIRDPPPATSIPASCSARRARPRAA